MAGEFETSVEYGLKLSKRIYYGKESATVAPAASTPPEPVRQMSRRSSTGGSGTDQQISYLPTAVTAYAVVSEPEAVDNPDVPSYQPYVHGRCDPPALIPLHMYGAELEVDCCLDHARVGFAGRWRVHCVKTGRSCDCRVAVPMGEKGTILSVEAEVTGRLYHSQLVKTEDAEELSKASKAVGGDGRYLKGNIYTFRIPQIAGGSMISVKVSWSQKLVYRGGQFSLDVPFSFPPFVNPIGSRICKREKILLNVKSGIDKEIAFKSSSHALMELRREVGKMGFSYEAEVKTWSASNFSFSYSVCSADLFGGVLLHTPFLREFEEKQMFCLHLFPGTNQLRKAFRKKVVFLVDISGSMKGDPLESTKNAIMSSLYKLNQEDSFNIIAFNREMYLFSPLMEPATKETIVKANQWINDKLLAEGGTNILPPLQQAMKLLAETTNSIPLIFLVTDGTVDDEREICNFVKASLASASTGTSITPRICTFGVGSFCNHYFLQMLAQVAKGHFDCAFDTDSVDSRLQRLFTTASSVLIANISIDFLTHLDSLELLPSSIPDLTTGAPLLVSGRYHGTFPESVKVTGTWADMTHFTMDVKVKRTKDLPLDRVLARRQIDLLTATAWLSQSKELEDKISISQVAKMSIQKGVPSEYTRMILIYTDKGEKPPETHLVMEVFSKLNSLRSLQLGSESAEKQNIYLGSSLGIGFGNLVATARNIPPGTEEGKQPDAAAKLVNAASSCCGAVADRVCCMCFIRACSHTSKQCSILASQICAALACFECISFCYELCACE
ncbi:unnamed protein product [Linum tenue]|uniref:VWFA domain-containing protein n=1 Tax=Linum tenue TaxID=586396 RepID=A0AAV0PPH0_9ROSI|nr:unnamed protein product [Linum tenue]